MTRVFDSNKLLGQLRKLRSDSTLDDADHLARNLIEQYDTNAILSPVEIEILAGVRDADELRLTERFLEKFEVVDRGRIPSEDWNTARTIAKRVVEIDRDIPRRKRRRPRDPRPKTQARQLGDCLITAIAKRLHLEIITEDRGIARQSGRTSGRKRS